MRAAQIEAYGGAEVIKINDVQKPSLKENQILIEVKAASLNPFDTSVREGIMKDAIPLTLPVTLGGDLAGVVVESNHTEFEVGSRVYGQANVVAGNSGAFAEFSATSSDQVALMPDNLSFEEAAALPLVGVSALQALEEHIHIQPGQKLFIHGGAGGIGSAAIQIAKDRGAFVAVSATGSGIDFVKSLGADQVVDYADQDFAEVISSFDAAVDTTAGQDLDKLLNILKPGGVLVSMLAQPDKEQAKNKGIIIFQQATKVNTEKLDKISDLIKGEILKPQVNKVFPLENTKEAFRFREQGKAYGKIVLSISG